ncbi:MAG: alpha/beta fold hydrolase, partial [Stellaceae bacterium]
AFEAALRKLDIPVLSLFGTEDRVVPTDTARLYRTILPRGHISMVYDAAHAIDAERPEAVAAIARDFLARGERFIVSNEPGLINP